MGAEIPSSTEKMACRRWNGRARLALPAKLMLPNEEMHCMLEDLSLGGARIRIEKLPRLGASVWLRFSDYEIFGSVAWARGHLCGLTFEERIPKDIILHMRALSDHFSEYEDSQARFAAEHWASGKD
ncbi:hypothetical protein MB02_04650 [Croceicoccus estronivorus]|uniref:PilZ domain-containing protein n=1 Tax=Croceicoccus estronivorus TaxID=1172626 RepID=UPI00082C14DB|nr:PilZ domain-containing protein [Croceicoccus estronivorus]OCC24766.1 hypothetical protein MB02_04650 [Croceicoccus estronivorus]